MCFSVFQCVVVCCIVNTSRGAGTALDQISLRGSIQCVCYSMLQCFSVCYSCCNVLLFVAMCSSVLQCVKQTVVCCSALHCQHKPCSSNRFRSDRRERLNIFCVRVPLCCSELQYVAACTVCYNVLQRVAACYSVVKCVVVCCRVLQCVTVRCSTRFNKMCVCVPVYYSVLERIAMRFTCKIQYNLCVWQCVGANCKCYRCCKVLPCVVVCRCVLQCIATWCSMVQFVVVYYSVVQCIDVCCSVLQRVVYSVL